MWKLKILLFGLTLFIFGSSVSEATMCYQCDSWEHRECGEYDTIDERFLVPCTLQGQLTSSTCLKEITTFDRVETGGRYDPQNQYNRPHVMRRCGISVLSNYRDENYYDKCYEREVLVNGYQGMRRVCSCSDDGCNSAMSSGIISLATLFSGLVSVFLSSKIF